MIAWWYAEQGQSMGPFDVDALARLFQTGRISPQTQVWREGLREWSPIAALVELRGVVMPFVPAARTQAVTADDIQHHDSQTLPAHFVVRYLARQFDCNLEFHLLTLGAIVLLSRGFHINFASFVDKNFLHFLLLAAIVIAVQPFCLVLDAGLYRIFGNTPGKAMLGIRVMDAQDRKPGFLAYLLRNIKVWLIGRGLGIPLLGSILSLVQAFIVGGGKPASYDESPRHTVTQTFTGTVPTIVFGILYTVFLLGGFKAEMSLVTYLDKHFNQPEASTTALSPSSYTPAPTPLAEAPRQVWQNPATQLSAYIAEDWQFSDRSKSDGHPSYRFVSADQQRVAIAMYIGSESEDFSGIIERIRKALPGFGVQLTESGVLSTYQALPVWQAKATASQLHGVQMELRIVQSHHGYWYFSNSWQADDTASQQKLDELDKALITTLV